MAPNRVSNKILRSGLIHPFSNTAIKVKQNLKTKRRNATAITNQYAIVVF